MKLVKAYPHDPEYDDMLKFFCPACQEYHVLSVGPKSFWKLRWTFNGDCNAPTVNPSLLVEKPRHNQRSSICHSFIRDGQIQYLTDCTHPLAGRTVPMTDIPDELSDCIPDHSVCPGTDCPIRDTCYRFKSYSTPGPHWENTPAYTPQSGHCPLYKP